MLISTANAQWNSTRSSAWWSQTEASLDNIFPTGLNDSTATKFIIGANGDTLQVRGKFYFWRANRFVPEDSLWTIAQLQSYISGLNYITDGNTNWDNSYGFITATLTDEEVQDVIGAMLTGNTETGITVTYQDGDGTIDFVVTVSGDTTGLWAQIEGQINNHTVEGTANNQFMHYDEGNGWITQLAAPHLDSLFKGGYTSQAVAYDLGAATSLEIPNAANPTTDAEGEIAWDSDDDAIEVYNGSASYVLPLLQSRTWTIIQPDSVQSYVDTLILMHVMAEAFAHGITIADISIQSDIDYTSEVFTFVELNTYPSTTPSVIEAVTSDTYYEEDDGTLSDASVASDAFVALVLDGTPENAEMVAITITYYINGGN